MISCTTFNILAPIYKRVDEENRESQYRCNWLTRNQNILDWLMCERSSILCLQEFWVGNQELVHMYEKRLADAGYLFFILPRTNNRGDGLLTALHKDRFRVLNYRELLFNDLGDRVAQLLHAQSVQQQFLIVNTHLLFPHNSSLSIVRLHQVYKILEYVESYQKDHNLNPMSIILCGDWNGSKRGHVYKFLRSQGFVSSYDTVHRYTDSDADAHKWVSHRNHRGNICGVDFIWLLNPNKYRKPLKASWSETLFSIVKYQFRKASLTGKDAFAFLKADSRGGYITYSGFCEALNQLGLTGHPHGLSAEETKDLWIQADVDGDGIVDLKKFQKRIWDPSWLEQTEENSEEAKEDVREDSAKLAIGFNVESIWDPSWLEQTEENSEEAKEDVREDSVKLAIGFNVENAVLFPPEVEKGMWPENYSLSDHARLTVVFSPIQVPLFQHI
ncbi:hypothetical protein GIB67_001653 [Kingdonia uniflora]|uniref:Endonuclease/exonuclease/phosphatase domain-containing protein n=1 Tax=Kingdonia uniflora TaxID=39325 RepID=A0A7J7L123_9MAGN|nr:hypothetical protein GIB67_001653 [Kingdonia uniflora]